MITILRAADIAYYILYVRYHNNTGRFGETFNCFVPFFRFNHALSCFIFSHILGSFSAFTSLITTKVFEILRHFISISASLRDLHFLILFHLRFTLLLLYLENFLFTLHHHVSCCLKSSVLLNSAVFIGLEFQHYSSWVFTWADFPYSLTVSRTVFCSWSLESRSFIIFWTMSSYSSKSSLFTLRYSLQLFIQE